MNQFTVIEDPTCSDVLTRLTYAWLAMFMDLWGDGALLMVEPRGNLFGETSRSAPWVTSGLAAG